ncbi:DNA mismatch repair endonuclease MutL [Photobacterium sp. ZSDE20]|uniref:DNA mismatch repair protein MutL n=1 Tax=Photobacterium pectinilyticum TaxID=2906793 RepID=A0ABT1N8A9_9GAMM|nr:DNA mismatch repair endonuclease MutL [Photobacterium sp. ZSDE20]MCQ1060982.1 DNA mismatch repair endonuclease MutL [Photobacterium sp. ZSDE20]MDD1828975.1 DNA mismatch repair endonuclease MutL [Photobacterium sp. ZSDE20]
MPIQILPARLANQIAAGEVVERPASVVKELVENSLDAGATRIDIDIDKGGSRTIRIRDNGKGIPKDELGLALSRHATSKIATLDDLEAIASLGFRGEALASISSVSRLTLTSRTAEQEEAWAAYAEGRDMEVQLKPAAHPVGTTLEVLDLFFNTPARRKFLRTEKTEFGHIDELLKRIALSRMDATINLRHNGKVIRQYRAANTQIQKERRLAAVCGQAFLEHALAVELAHGDLKLGGWICSPQGARSQNDIQYCYVNGRMMKDKLINHAIRQAYETSLAADQYAAYVLFIEVDPHQVDVNVHPAKHEVRFHQARLVHDFICQGLQSALIEGAADDAEQVVNAPAPRASARAPEAPYSSASSSTPSSHSHGIAEPNAALAAVARTPDYPNKAPARDWLTAAGTPSGSTAGSDADVQGSEQSSGYRDGTDTSYVPSRDEQTYRGNDGAKGGAGRSGGNSRSRYQDDGPSPEEVEVYQQLMQTVASSSTPASSTLSVSSPSLASPSPAQPQAKQPASFPERKAVSQVPTRQDAIDTTNGVGLGKALSLVAKQYLLLNRDNGLALLSLPRAQSLRTKGQLRLAQGEGLKPQPLLIPHSIPVEPDMINCVEQHAMLLKQLGIQLKAKNKQQLIILSVCQPLRQQNLQQLIPALLAYLMSVAEDAEAQGWDKLLDWLVGQLTVPTEAYTLSQAIQLVTELEQLWGPELEHYFSDLLRPVDVSAAVEAFNYD